jgi:hypothetical protein
MKLSFRLFNGADFANEHRITYWHFYLMYYFFNLVKTAKSSKAWSNYLMTLISKSKETIECNDCFSMPYPPKYIQLYYRLMIIWEYQAPILSFFGWRWYFVSNIRNQLIKSLLSLYFKALDSIKKLITYERRIMCNQFLIKKWKAERAFQKDMSCIWSSSLLLIGLYTVISLHKIWQQRGVIQD